MEELNIQNQRDTMNSSSKLVLYNFSHSSCSWRVRFALKLKGLDYEYKAVNLVKGEQFSREFEQVNPLHYVPVLVDGDVVVSDSLAILLKNILREHLLPDDHQRKALNLQVASIVCSSIQPLHMVTLAKHIEEKVGPEEGILWALSIIEKGFYALEKLLKDFATRFATGEELYMADMFLAPEIDTVAKRYNIDMSAYPILNRVYEAYKTVPEFLAASPEAQPDAAFFTPPA
uniref:glutathione transferase n=1 Tax=Salix viminalis TaxID=40686 RepID=A0A6N2MUN6_SALVM